MEAHRTKSQRGLPQGSVRPVCANVVGHEQHPLHRARLFRADRGIARRLLRAVGATPQPAAGKIHASCATITWRVLRAALSSYINFPPSLKLSRERGTPMSDTQDKSDAATAEHKRL